MAINIDWHGAFDDPIPLPGRYAPCAMPETSSPSCRSPSTTTRMAEKRPFPRQMFPHILVTRTGRIRPAITIDRLCSGSFVAVCQGGTLGSKPIKLKRRLGPPMCRISLLALIISIASWSACQGAGSFQTKPAFQSGATSVTFSTPNISVPNVPASNLIGGCGRGRVRDSRTHTCRGPGDVR